MAPAIVRSIVKAAGPLGGRDRDLALSRDGRRLAYAANGRLYVRALSDPESRPIPGIEGAHGPFFAPAGDWVAFFSGNQLRRVGLGGEAVQTLAEIANGQQGTWSDDGWIYFALARPSGILRVRATGGVPETGTSLADDIDHNFPIAVPWASGRHSRRRPGTEGRPARPGPGRPRRLVAATGSTESGQPLDIWDGCTLQ